MKALGLALLLLTGCTHWSHLPPVPLDQHKADLRACIDVALGPPLPIVFGTSVSPAVNTAIAGLGLAATIAEEIQFERRLEACMQARGYQRAGFTTNLYGWSNP